MISVSLFWIIREINVIQYKETKFLYVLKQNMGIFGMEMKFDSPRDGSCFNVISELPNEQAFKLKTEVFKFVQNLVSITFVTPSPMFSLD